MRQRAPRSSQSPSIEAPEHVLSPVATAATVSQGHVPPEAFAVAGAADIQRMQSLAGNQAVSRLIAGQHTKANQPRAVTADRSTRRRSTAVVLRRSTATAGRSHERRRFRSRIGYVAERGGLDRHREVRAGVPEHRRASP